MYSIELKNVSKEYKDFKLSDISMVVPEGSVVGLIGKNGAGKTTMLKLILDCIKRNSGEIQIFGLDNRKAGETVKEQIGVVWDECAFHETINVLDINKIMKHIYKQWNEETYRSYIKRFHLPEKKTIKEYSRGMKMKLSIATALSHNAKLLILDEPTGGLDPVVRNEILDIFMEFMQDESHSILMSSHITSDLEHIADYITFIDEGKIIFSELKDNLLEQHGILKCGAEVFEQLDAKEYIGYKKNAFGYEVLVKDRFQVKRQVKDALIDGPALDEIMQFYIEGVKTC